MKDIKNVVFNLNYSRYLAICITNDLKLNVKAHVIHNYVGHKTSNLF